MRSGGLIDCLGHACLDRLSGLSRYLLSERAEFLILRGHDLELLAHLRGRQLDKLRWGLHTQQLMSIVKGGARVDTDNLEKLEIVICDAIGSGLVGIFERVDCFLAGYLGLPVSIPGTFPYSAGRILESRILASRSLCSTPFSAISRSACGTCQTMSPRVSSSWL